MHCTELSRYINTLSSASDFCGKKKKNVKTLLSGICLGRKSVGESQDTTQNRCKNMMLYVFWNFLLF